LAYVILLTATTMIRRRNANPAALQARRAYSVLVADLNKVTGKDPNQAYDLLLEALQQYLGAKLRLPAAALTFREVEGPLKNRGVNDSSLQELRQIFTLCEAGRYGGSGNEEAGKNLDREILTLARELERRLR
ncbi:MAG: hypothetical protein JXA52_01390, partial [Planctomycetes bacterium]|nr:hypothetical protein [Planctomycetota bacterium]